MFKPMLATQYDEETVKKHFKTSPLLASPKLDGIRCVIKGQALARSLKPIPNAHVQKLLSKPAYEHYDGELVVGLPNSPTVYTDSFSGVMSKDGEPDFTFWVFDHIEQPDAIYLERMARIKTEGQVRFLPQKMVKSLDELLAFETEMLAQGFEGVMIRKPNAPYKFGRSTAKELYLCKVKREDDYESVILDVYEAFENTNEAFTNELGHTDRSTHAEGMVGKGMVGGFVIEKDGVQFNCSAGKFTHDQRIQIWQNKEKVIGKFLKYRAFAYGVKDAPRFPRALGFRDPIDM
jgi:DNA ligase-1